LYADDSDAPLSSGLDPSFISQSQDDMDVVPADDPVVVSRVKCAINDIEDYLQAELELIIDHQVVDRVLELQIQCTDGCTTIFYGENSEEKNILAH